MAHPVERLRYIAQAGDADPSLLAREAAYALAQVAETDLPGLVPACRRLIDRHLSAGPLWWLSARALADPDPGVAARQAAEELDEDPTDRRLARELPEDAAVLIVGWPDLTGAALRRRGDLEALIAEGGGEGNMLARRLRDSGNELSVVPDSGIGAAAVVADLVVVEAHAAGPSGLLANRGSHAAAAVAHLAGIPVWAVAGVGRVLPSAMWDALLARIDEEGDEPWERPVEVVPSGLVSAVIGPAGLAEGVGVLSEPTCLVAPELLRATA